MNTGEAELIARVDSLVTLSHAFRELLQRELTLLANWPRNDLPEITREKLALASRLQEAERARHDWLRAAGHHDTDQAAMTAALSGSAAGRGALARWLALHNLARECQETHRQIGSCLSLQASQTLRMLEILGATRGISVTYGRNGLGRLGGNRQNLGQA